MGGGSAQARLASSGCEAQAKQNRARSPMRVVTHLILRTRRRSRARPAYDKERAERLVGRGRAGWRAASPRASREVDRRWAWVPRVARGGGATRGDGEVCASVGDLRGTPRHKGLDPSFRLPNFLTTYTEEGLVGKLGACLHVLPHHL